MQAVTLAIGILGAILVILPRPAYALAVYFSFLVWFPEYLRVSIGTIDISVGRIIIAVLLLRCLLNNQLRDKFVWSRFDTWLTAAIGVFVVMYLATHPLGAAIENRGGFVMDSWFTYIVVRLIIRDKATLISFLKIISIVLVALAVLGVSEAVSGKYYFLELRRFRVWNTPLGDIILEKRWGFGRANGPFSHSIMFGSCFVMFLPLVRALRHQRDYWAKLSYPLSGIVILGAISSMSSGPWGMLLVLLFCLVLEKYKYWAKVVLVLLVVLCILAEIGSNRPLHYVVLSYGNLGKGDWYQRAILVDSAIEDFDKWWLAGYGGRDPGWGARYGEYTDANNEFILAGIEYGLLGIIALCAVIVTAFRALVRAFKETTNKELQSIYWALGSSLVGIIVIWQGVSFFGQMPSLFYTILGIIGSSIGFAKYVSSNGYRLVKTNNYGLILAHEQIRTV